MEILKFNDFSKSYRIDEHQHTIEAIDENVLNSILNFFKGLFNLFSDKKVKKESEDMNDYFSEIISDESLTKRKYVKNEINTKRVRKASSSVTEAIKERIKVDLEKHKDSITSQDVRKIYSSWLAMVITQQEICKIPIVEKMTKNPDLSKKFSWVPEKYWPNVKDFYKKSDSQLDKRISEALLKIANSPKKELPRHIENFSAAYAKYVYERYKETNQFTIIKGFAKSIIQVEIVVESLLKNTSDDKLSDMITDSIMEERKKAPKKKESDTETRSRKAKKSGDVEEKPTKKSNSKVDTENRSRKLKK